MAGILKVDKYQDFNGNDIMTSDGSGNITINNAALKNTPYFLAHSDSTQSVANVTYTKATLGTEILDSENSFASSRFTPQTAGKYFIFGSISSSEATLNLVEVTCAIYKNGTIINYATNFNYNNAGGLTNFKDMTVKTEVILDMNGSTDYVELYGRIGHYTGSTQDFVADRTVLGGYKLIG